MTRVALPTLSALRQLNSAVVLRTVDSHARCRRGGDRSGGVAEVDRIGNQILRTEEYEIMKLTFMLVLQPGASREIYENEMKERHKKQRQNPKRQSITTQHGHPRP